MRVENILNGRIKPGAIVGAEWWPHSRLAYSSTKASGMSSSARTSPAERSCCSAGPRAEYWQREKNRTGEDAQVAARRAEQERVALARGGGLQMAKDQEACISGVQTQSESPADP